MKECFKPHVLLHSVAGLGVGLVVAALLFSAMRSALWLGVIIFVGTVVYEMMMGKKNMPMNQPKM